AAFVQGDAALLLVVDGEDRCRPQSARLWTTGESLCGLAHGPLEIRRVFGLPSSVVDLCNRQSGALHFPRESVTDGLYHLEFVEELARGRLTTRRRLLILRTSSGRDALHRRSVERRRQQQHGDGEQNRTFHW